MRALGASRGTVVAVLLIESLLLAATGLVIGLVLAHVLAASVGAWLPAAGASRGRRAGMAAGGMGHRRAGARCAGIIATLLPAWRAYRLDVAATLADQ